MSEKTNFVAAVLNNYFGLNAVVFAENNPSLWPLLYRTGHNNLFFLGSSDVFPLQFGLFPVSVNDREGVREERRYAVVKDCTTTSRRFVGWGIQR